MTYKGYKQSKETIEKIRKSRTGQKLMEEDKKVIIGVPVHNGLESLKIAVESIINSTTYPFTMIFIESESTDGSAEYLDRLSMTTHIPKVNENRFEVIHTKKEGPLKAYNMLFQIAKKRGCDLYLTQTDVKHFQLYKRDWLFEMHEIAKKPEIGLIAPEGAWGKTEICKPEIDTFYWIGGWSCYIPNRIINEFGGYDTGYEIGDKVDIDYSFMVFKKGYSLAKLDYYVQHHWMIDHEHENMTDINEIRKRTTEYFRRKHVLD